MALSKEEKEYFRPTLKAVKTKQNLKDLIYALYVEHNYTYHEIKTILITHSKFSKINLDIIINFIHSFNIKKCSRKNCVHINGKVQPLSNFCKNRQSSDGLSNQCNDCQTYNKLLKKYDEEKKKYLKSFHSLKTIEERKDYILELFMYTNLKISELSHISFWDYQDIVNLISVEHGMKKCAEFENCKNSTGSIQFVENFTKCSNSPDNKYRLCNTCLYFYKNYKNADDEKRYLMDTYQLCQTNLERKEFIISMYIHHDKTVNNIHAITLLDREFVISVLKEFDVKKCLNYENCRSFEGYIQSRNNFFTDSSHQDGISNYCKNCITYRDLKHKNNQIKINMIDHIKELNSKKEIEEYLIYIYKKCNFTYSEMQAITTFDMSEIINILKKYNIRICSKGDQCKNINGPILTFDDFSNNSGMSDNKNSMCIECFKHYYLENVDYIKEYRIKRNQQFANYSSYVHKIDFVDKVRRDPNNQKLIQVQCKLCKKWFNPTNRQIALRVHALFGKSISIGTENNLYCSQECKDSCPLYNTNASTLITQQRLKSNNLKKEDFQRMTQELRSYFLKLRNPNRCELCEEEFNQKDLILHHIVPVAIEHMLEADEDNVIFICKDCHSKTHQIDGCQNNQLSQFSQETYLC